MCTMAKQRATTACTTGGYVWVAHRLALWDGMADSLTDSGIEPDMASFSGPPIAKNLRTSGYALLVLQLSLRELRINLQFSGMEVFGENSLPVETVVS